MIDFFISLDEKLFILINQYLSATWLDGLMAAISNKAYWIPLYAVFIFFILRKFRFKAWLPIVFILLSVSATDLLSNRVFKPLFQRPRPCYVAELNARTPKGINPWNPSRPDYGFVSSHAANHFAIAIFIILLLKPRRLWLFALLFWACIIAWSRVYLGKHYPLDVFFGAMLGCSIALIFFVIMQKVWKRFQL